MFVTLNISSAQGYGADQIENPLTLAEMLAAVEEAIEEFGEDAEVVTYDGTNTYGAKYGNVSKWNTFNEVGSEDGGF